MLICARSDEFNTIPQITDEMRLQLNMALLRHRDADQVLAEERANYKHTHAHNAAKRERLREQRNQARAKGELTTKPRNSDYTIPQHAPNHNLPDNTPTKLIPKENIDVEMDRVRALKNPDYLKYKASLEKPTQEHHQGPTTGLESIQIEDEE